MRVTELQRRLRQRRLDHGWSYEDLALDIKTHVEKAAHPSPATLRRFIHNEREPHETTVHAIRSYLTRVEAPAPAECTR